MKKEPWRWIVFGLSVAYIVYTWVQKSLGDSWVALPQEDLLPMAVISIAVTALKVILIAGGILLLKWIAGKLKK